VFESTLGEELNIRRRPTLHIDIGTTSDERNSSEIERCRHAIASIVIVIFLMTCITIRTLRQKPFYLEVVEYPIRSLVEEHVIAPLVDMVTSRCQEYARGELHVLLRVKRVSFIANGAGLGSIKMDNFTTIGEKIVPSSSTSVQNAPSPFVHQPRSQKRSFSVSAASSSSSNRPRVNGLASSSSDPHDEDREPEVPGAMYVNGNLISDLRWPNAIDDDAEPEVPEPLYNEFGELDPKFKWKPNNPFKVPLPLSKKEGKQPVKPYP